MKNLKYFIGGVISVLFILPLLNKLLEVVELWIESLKIKPQMKILNGNKDSVIMREFLKPSPPLYEEICEDDDFEDFDE